MAFIPAILLVLGLFINHPELPGAASASQNAERVVVTDAVDDSANAAKKGITAGGTNPCDPDYILSRNNLFASWVRERVQGYNIHELDPLELRRIGLVVADDGTVWRTKGKTAEGMQEVDGRNTTRWFIQFKATNPVDSARLAQEFQKGEAETKRTGVNHPIQVAEEINVEPVLITNSRGYTFSHSQDITNAGDPSTIGSGKYRGQELVAIRVQYKGPAMPADTAGYFYIYWYEPSEGFLTLLPPRVRQEIAQRQETRSTGGATSDKLAGGLTVSTLHPNPVTQDVATLHFTLSEARSIMLTIYDVNGKRVKDLAATPLRDPGEWQESFPLVGIPDGYYLLTVTTDKGEQNIHPMVLKR